MEENRRAAFCNLFIATRPAAMISDTRVFLSILKLYFSQFENYIFSLFTARLHFATMLQPAGMISHSRDRECNLLLKSDLLNSIFLVKGHFVLQYNIVY